MAYSGRIQYMSVNKKVEWNRAIMLSQNTVLKAYVQELINCIIRRDGERCILRKKLKYTELFSSVRRKLTRTEEGTLIYDEVDRLDDDKPRCVVVGREYYRKDGSKHPWEGDTKQKYYVLIVAGVSSRKGEDIYERVGVGCVPSSCISPELGKISQIV